MALRINTNITAINAHRNLVANDTGLSRSIERLSSGMRINRAADDAAGLTISEKLRTQVRGINRAIMNVQDGISLIQTAEGALNEIHSMLQRMRELALQSANDTLTTTDRLEIQKEVVQLKDEINRISYGTEFNTRKLLDGTGTAVISTSDPRNLDGVVTGQVLTFSDFSIVVWPKTDGLPNDPKVYRGVGQQQRSHIFVREDGVIASGSTTLQSISNFYDNNGRFILELPQTLFIQGDNAQGQLVVSRDITLNELVNRIYGGMTKDQLGRGLDFAGSTSTFSDVGETNGQILVKSGRTGILGRVNFTGEENLVKALGFQETVPPEEPVYSVTVTNIGLPVGERTSTTTQIAGHRAAGLIKGIDLMFEPMHAAFVDTKPATLAINIPTGGVPFALNDYRNDPLNQVSIVVPAGQHGMQQIVSFINDEIAAAGTNLRITARLNDAYAIEFTTLDAGSAAFVRVSGASSNVLGIANGKYTGSGGNAGMNTAIAVIDDFDFTANAVVFSIADTHGNNTVVSLADNYTPGGLQSLVNEINNQISANSAPESMLIRAEIHQGLLRFRSLETGYQSNFEITQTGGTGDIQGDLKIVAGRTITGFNGIPAVQNFAYDQYATFYGYNINNPDPTLPATPAYDGLEFRLADLDGNMVTISIAGGTPLPGSGSMINLIGIANEINQRTNAANPTVKIQAEINPLNNTIRLFSTIPGRDGRVVVTDLSNPAGNNPLLSVLGITPKSYGNGVGNYAYTMHVKDTSIQFQIGPNEGHFAKANIIRTDIKALGIEDLDLTTVKSSEIAIGLIDKALQMVSSERAKLGAIENRMNYTNNSLRVALENTAASESRIRDVDMAREVIEMTKFQVLQQSSNAMLAQANIKAQRVLDLLR